MPDAITLLKTRRSVKPIELLAPGPSADEIETLLTIATRVPDHGKLAPWRFIIFEGEARERAGAIIAAVFAANNPGATADQLAFERNRRLCPSRHGEGQPHRERCHQWLHFSPLALLGRALLPTRRPQNMLEQLQTGRR